MENVHHIVHHVDEGPTTTLDTLDVVRTVPCLHEGVEHVLTYMALPWFVISSQ